MKQFILLTLFCAGIGLAACSEKNEVPTVPVTEIRLTASSLTLLPEQGKQLRATVIPTDATNRNLIWSSDDPTIATISEMGIVVGVKTGKTTVTAMSAADNSIKAQCIVTVMNRIPYVVGDLYPDAENPTGVVFWIDPADAAKGKAVSLDEEFVSWGPGKTETTARDLNDGTVNLNVIKTIANWETDFPAFKWCAGKGTGWYLPALNELLTVCDSKEELNKIFQNNGGTPLSENDYWTSTEQDKSPKTIALTVSFRQNAEDWASKDGTCRTRAVIAF